MTDAILMCKIPFLKMGYMLDVVPLSKNGVAGYNAYSCFVEGARLRGGGGGRGGSGLERGFIKKLQPPDGRLIRKESLL